MSCARVRIAGLLLSSLLITPAAAQARCVVSVQNLVFGTYDPASPVPTQGIADYVLDCRSPVVVTIEIGTSTLTGSTANRRMTHASHPDTLAYNVFRDSAMTQVWGDRTGNASKVERVSGQVMGRIYGQIFPGQDAWIGEYSDFLRVTILP